MDFFGNIKGSTPSPLQAGQLGLFEMDFDLDAKWFQ